MKRHILYILAIAMLSLTACSEKDIMQYEDQPALYLVNSEKSFSFFYSETGGDKDTVHVTVHAMGYPSTVDRAFTLCQLNEGEADAAVPGTHYLAFSSDEMRQLMVMPAGKSEVVVPITLIKDASLDTKTVKLKIGITPNENFTNGIVEKDSTVVTFSSQAIKPSNWDDWYYAFGGNWGTVKMRFIIDNTGITNFDKLPDDYYYLLYLNNKLKDALNQYNATHDTPLQEADGTLVDFDNAYNPYG